MVEPIAATSPEPRAPSVADTRMLYWETLGSVLWLLMDGTWMLGWEIAALLMICPCVVGNLMVFRFTPRIPAVLAVTGAMNCWLGMNVFWMLADLRGLPSLLIVSRVFLAVGCGLLLVAFAASRWRPQARAALLARFRRLRVQLPRRPGT